MRRALPLLAVLLCASLASQSRADVQQPCEYRWGTGEWGLILSLDDCGDFGQWRSTIDCATNSGMAINAVASIILPAAIDRVVAIEGYFVVETSGRTISPWWSFDGCRASALTFSADFTEGPFNCNDYWAGQASGGGYVVPGGPIESRFQIRCVFASPHEQTMDPGAEHYLFKMRISRTKSTGTGSCPGCNDRACVLFDRLLLSRAEGIGDQVITQPGNGGSVLYGDLLIPAANRSWGQVKALYR